LILVAGVWRHGRPGAPRTLIALGLLLGAVGDVLLAWPRDHFVAGLVAFLASHLCYIGAFVHQERSPAPLWLLPFGAVGATMFAVVYPGLGTMWLPVAAYVVVIAAMAWRAGALVGRVSGGEAAVLGAALFLMSDSMLAFNKFRSTFPFAGEAVMVSYWAAQFWIARSVMPRRLRA
jgi:alkenylglycerophosphocholine/alkenylglycerophosphoethanolamine hydrolase